MRREQVDETHLMRMRLRAERRRAEVLVLELRRELKTLGFEGISIGVVLADPSGESDPPGRDGTQETSSSSVDRV